MKVLPGGEIRRPTADVGQALRFREVCTLPSQFLRQSLVLCDVDCRTVKRFENSIFKNRDTDAANVTYLPVWSNNRGDSVAAPAHFMHHPDGFRHRGSVVRVDGGQILLKVRRPVPRVKAENFVYLVRPIDAQIIRPTDAQILCRPAPYMSEALPFAEIKLASLKGFLGALAVGDVLGRTENLVGTSRRVFFQVAQAVHDSHFPVGAKKSVFTVRACSGTNSLSCRPKHSLTIVGVN